MVVHKLHYEFHGWLGDHLLETSPCFIVSDRLGVAITQASLTGTVFDDVEVTTSPLFHSLHPDRRLPSFFRMKVTGNAGSEDFGLVDHVRLVVSNRALDLLRTVGIPNASVVPFPNG